MYLIVKNPVPVPVLVLVKRILLSLNFISSDKILPSSSFFLSRTSTGIFLRNRMATPLALEVRLLKQAFPPHSALTVFSIFLGNLVSIRKIMSSSFFFRELKTWRLFGCLPRDLALNDFIFSIEADSGWFLFINIWEGL